MILSQWQFFSLYTLFRHPSQVIRILLNGQEWQILQIGNFIKTHDLMNHECGIFEWHKTNFLFIGYIFLNKK